MPEVALQCRAATIFKKNGDIDDDAFRQYLQRFIDSKIDVYLASAGSGEGHTLRWDELRRVYEIGVETCKGKVEVNANPPEQNTARATIEQSELAISAGVEVVNVYQPAAWHGYRPKGDELRVYYETVLSAIKHTVALAPNPLIGVCPSAALVADLCHRFPQIVSINLVAQPEIYFLELKAALKRDVKLFVDMRGLPSTLALGAAGIVGGNLNLLPKTYRAFVDCYEQSDVAGMAQHYASMLRVNEYTAKWNDPNSRVVKMFMTAFKMPGWEGGLREPCRMPPADELDEFAAGLRNLGVPEFDAIAMS